MKKCQPLFSILVITLFVLLFLPAIGLSEEEHYGLSPTDKFIPRDQYELEYLGLLGDKNGENHQGVFQLIWKGKKAFGLDGFLIGNPKNFYPSASFSYHFKSGWELVPEPPRCGFGMIELPVQPNQLTKLIVDMSGLEADSQKPSISKKANRVALLIGGSQGMLVSDEFSLPPVP